MNCLAIAFAAGFALLGSAASAAVVAGPSIGGYDTFTDTNTGLHWLKLDSFFGLSHNRMAVLAQNAGFVVAERPAVETLLNSLPLGGGEWASYKAVMGDAPNRELIWGSYAPADANNRVGYAYAYDDDITWDIIDSVEDADGVPNQGFPDFRDMNIWAYAGGNPGVPEPATWAIMLGGFGLVGVSLRRRRMAVVHA